MQLRFVKYHAVGNDFIVLDSAAARIGRRSLPALTRRICERHTGVGGDGVLWLSPSRKADCKMDVFNSDGGWAEKSGNGLRIVGVHLGRRHSRRKTFEIETGTSVDHVKLGRRLRGGFQVTTALGVPQFEAGKVPVRTRQKYLINSPVKIGGVALPMTCLAVGNPHAIVLVDNFDFDWKLLGADIEHAAAFPNGTNVEFVRLVSRRKLELSEWERGAGATGSSGTGAAAAVAAMVMLGLTDRKCEVSFQYGSLGVDWDEKSGVISIQGSVHRVAEGIYDYVK
jgi:diaminopimelate epimerase